MIGWMRTVSLSQIRFFASASTPRRAAARHQRAVGAARAQRDQPARDSGTRTRCASIRSHQGRRRGQRRSRRGAYGDLRARGSRERSSTPPEVDPAARRRDGDGAEVEINTIPGYLPQRNDRGMANSSGANVEAMFGPALRHRRPRTGSTDMGDIAHLMPVIHPMVASALGKTTAPISASTSPSTPT